MKASQNFIFNSLDTQVLEKPPNYLDPWEGPQMIREEINKLEIIINIMTERFKNQLETVVSKQDTEYYEFEKRIKSDPESKSPIDQLLEFRSFQKKEADDLRTFHIAFLRYFKANLKKLSLAASEISILEYINKIERCNVCGHIIKMMTDRPLNLPDQYLTANGSIINMEETQIQIEPKRRDKDHTRSLDTIIPTDEGFEKPTNPSSKTNKTPSHRYSTKRQFKQTPNPMRDSITPTHFQPSIQDDIQLPIPSRYGEFDDIKVKTPLSRDGKLLIRRPRNLRESVLNDKRSQTISPKNRENSNLKPSLKKDNPFDSIEKKDPPSDNIEQLPWNKVETNTQKLFNRIDTKLPYINQRINNIRESMSSQKKDPQQSYLDFIANSSKYSSQNSSQNRVHFSKPNSNPRENQGQIINQSFGPENKKPSKPKILRPPKDTEFNLKQYLQKANRSPSPKNKNTKREASPTKNKSFVEPPVRDGKMRIDPEFEKADILKKEFLKDLANKSTAPVSNQPTTPVENKNNPVRQSHLDNILRQGIDFTPPSEKYQRPTIKAGYQNNLQEISSFLEETKKKEKPIENQPPPKLSSHKPRVTFLRKGHETEEPDPERDNYITKLIAQKPWLGKQFLRRYKLNVLKFNFPLDDQKKVLTEADQLELEREVRFIRENVEPFREQPRELKTDVELAYDVRYYNKYGDFLIKRIAERSYYERLDIQKECIESEIKAAYRAKALIWHPDNIKQIDRLNACFANEQYYSNIIAEIFKLIDEAYRTLTDSEKRKAYDAGLQRASK